MALQRLKDAAESLNLSGVTSALKSTLPRFHHTAGGKAGPPPEMTQILKR